MDSKFSQEQVEYFCYLTDVIREKMVAFLNLPYTQNPETKRWTPVYPDTPDIMKQKTSHGSQHVLGHSIWSALYMENFFYQNSRFSHGLNSQVATLCGFFHDIAKATNCGLTCRENNTCWLDVYSELNYHGKGDAVHPEVGGDVVLGKERFWSKCPKSLKVQTIEELDKWKKTNAQASLLIPHEYFEWAGVNFRIVALTTYMHWEIGKINYVLGASPSDLAKQNEAYDRYLALFVGKCQQSKLKPSIELLRLCILVAFADILAASLQDLPSANINDELYKKVNDLKKIPFFKNLLKKVKIADLRSYYTSTNPWRTFKMDKNSEVIYDQLLKFAVLHYKLK